MRKLKLAITLSLFAATFVTAPPALAVVGASGDATAFSDRVVMVLTRGPEGSGFCTGVVLAKTIVLTAAHCIKAPSDMRVFFRDASGQPVALEIAAAAPHPDFRPNAQKQRTRSMDIGLVATKEPLPDAFHPATLASGDPPGPGEPVVVAGYGIAREGDAKSGGVLRQAQLQVREPRSHILLWLAPTGAGSGACSGDSGGPIFDPEGNTVLATVAWTEGAGGTKCGSLTQGVLVAPVAEWIQAEMRRLSLAKEP